MSLQVALLTDIRALLSSGREEKFHERIAKKSRVTLWDLFPIFGHDEGDYLDGSSILSRSGPVVHDLAGVHDQKKRPLMT